MPIALGWPLFPGLVSGQMALAGADLPMAVWPRLGLQLAHLTAVSHQAELELLSHTTTMSWLACPVPARRTPEKVPSAAWPVVRCRAGPVPLGVPSEAAQSHEVSADT